MKLKFGVLLPRFRCPFSFLSKIPSESASRSTMSIVHGFDEIYFRACTDNCSLEGAM